MLKKLRWRFIFSAMTAIFAVMAILLLAINMLNFSITTKRLDATLQRLEAHGDAAPESFEKRNAPRPDWFFEPGPQAQNATLFFSVYCNEEGEILRISNRSDSVVSDAEAEEYTADVLKKNKSLGYYGSYRYLVHKNDYGILLIFLNCATELQTVRTLLVVSCIVAVVSLLAMFILVALFSKRAIAPYVQNIERQKQFITDAGHELKTPLTSIATSADVLAMEYDRNEWIQNIQKQTQRLSKLVGNLVALSRLDEERPFPDKAEFSLTDAAWEISESFAALAKAKGKIYSQNIEDGLSLLGDRESVLQMMSILLDNAVKYSNEGGRIRFDVYRRHRNTVIEVFNTCDLEDTKDIDRLFDRFYRPDKSRSSKAGGTGIGLAIAQATAKAHNGKITVKSEDGKSIRFKITL